MRDFYETFPSSTARLALAPTFPDYVEDIVLAADTLARIKIPTGATFFLLSFDADTRVKLGTSAATFSLPAGTTANGSGSESNPAARRIPAALADGSTIPTHVLLRAASA